MCNVLGCVNVHHSKVAIKEKYGKYEKVLDPGCHCVPWYLGSRIVGHVDLRVQEMHLRCETKTKDDVFVNAIASIHYRAVRDTADDAFYKLTNPRGQIQAYVEDAIRSKVLNLTLKEFFEQRDDVATADDPQLKSALALYGYVIVKIIINVQPDENIKSEMNEAARLRLAATAKAEAEKMLLIRKAEAEAESRQKMLWKWPWQ